MSLPPRPLALLLAALALPALAGVAVDDAILLRAAQGRALPRRLSPPREAALERVIAHFRRDQVDRGLSEFASFADGYFRPSTAEDLEPIVLNLLRRGFLESRDDLLQEAESAAWLEERALAASRHLDQLDAALREGRRGELPSIAGLELAGVEPQPFGEPFRWLQARPMRRGDIEQERILWGRRLVMAQEDAIAARVRLQGRVQAHREAVRRLSRAALAMLDAGDRALARRS